MSARPFGCTCIVFLGRLEVGTERSWLQWLGTDHPGLGFGWGPPCWVYPCRVALAGWAPPFQCVFRHHNGGQSSVSGYLSFDVRLACRGVIHMGHEMSSIYIYMYRYTYMCTHTYIYIYANMCIYIYIHTYLCI